MAAKPETVFRAKVRVRLERIPGSFWESIQQKAIRGTPDILGCINGHFVGLELKASEKSPISPLQEYKLKEIANAGGLGLIVYPENFKNIVDVLEHLALK